MRHRSTFVILLALLIAAPAFAQGPPNRIDVVQRVAAADAARFDCAHTDRGCAYDYIEALVCELQKADPRFGMNGRRGDPGRPSWDAVNWCGGGPATDPTGGCRGRLTIIDVIAGAGGPNPQPAWIVFDSDPTAGAWIQPDCGAVPTPPPTPTPTPTPAPVDLGPVLARIDALAAQLERLTQQGGAIELKLEALAAQAAAIANDANVGALAVLDVKNWLASGLIIELRVPTFGGTARGTARRP